MPVRLPRWETSRTILFDFSSAVISRRTKFRFRPERTGGSTEMVQPSARCFGCVPPQMVPNFTVAVQAIYVFDDATAPCSLFQNVHDCAGHTQLATSDGEYG